MVEDNVNEDLQRMDKSIESIVQNSGDDFVVQPEEYISSDGRKMKGIIGKEDVKTLTTNLKAKPKYQRTYRRYIEKKISPIIFSDVLAMLSDAQKEWVAATGFSDLLDFSMETYPHSLGYDIVESFESSTCSLKLKAGHIRITEKVVNNVLGLPNGNKKIVIRKNQELLDRWRSQFLPKLVSRVSPSNVYLKIRETEAVTEFFKLNFLVLLSNFLIESNLNMFVNPDILGFDGDIDSCKEYNWCEFLIRKLISTHKYWIQKPSRSFTGPLPFFIYLYIDRLAYGRYVDVVRKFPAFKAWSDLLLRDRQKYEKEHKTFGVGVILQWPDEEISNKVDDHDIEKCRQTDDKCLDDAQRSDVQKNVEKNLVECSLNGQLANIIHGSVVFSGNSSCTDTLIPSNKKVIEVLSEDEALDDSLDEENLIDYYEDVVGQLEQVFKEVSSVHITAFLLYPDNPKIMELKNRVMNICVRDMNQNQTPQTPQETPNGNKSSSYDIPLDSQPPLPTQFYMEMDRISAERFKHYSIHPKEDEIPSFSLGLSQIVPRKPNECSETENACEENGEQITIIEGIECREDVGGLLNRPKRELKLSENLRSPYVSRVINISTRIITTQENAVWEWLFLECENVFEDLFQWNDRSCTREQLRTLKENEMIMGNVINCWTYLLNENEKRRSSSSPLRLFCGIETTYGPLHDPFSKGSYISFTENMDIVTCMAKYMHGRQLAEEDFDMIFFPIYANSHHYIIVYNVKHPSWEIIDNIEGSQDVVQRYGNLPFNLHSFFIRWMKELMIPAWVRMYNLQPVIIDMSWQTEENGVDCGIFVMRHMETYMGTSVSEWDTGLAKESARQKRQLDKLRIIYCFELLTSRLNRKREEIIEAAVRYSKGKVDDVLDVDSRGRKIIKTYKRVAVKKDRLHKK